MSDKNDPTYIFENKETKEVMWFMPIAKLLKFLSAKELGFDLYSASGNTCQINGMLGEVIKENAFLAEVLPKFTNIDISRIHETLKKAPVDSRDGWQSQNNPITIIGMFNNNSSDNSVEYNREIALSCSGVKDWDMFDVICDDFLSKYFEKATEYGKNHRELLYYRNFNIRKTGKLVTGMSNFNTEIFRSELLKQYCFLDIDMCIYNFSDYQDKNKTQALFKLIVENVFLNDNQEYNLYDVDEKELARHAESIDQQISDFLKLANSNNELCVKYDTNTRRFLMVDEKKNLRDATAYLYTTLCNYLKENNLAKSEGKLKEFVENENNSAMMDEVTGNHYQEKFNLVKNIAEYFESDLLDSALKAIEFTEKEKIEMKIYFFDKSPLEFFFKNPDEIKTKLSEDKNCDIGNNPDKEDSITKYILEENIDEILTDQGKEFLDMIKKITRDNKYFKDRIKEDEMDKTFEQYQSQNGVNCTYKNNSPNKKTKIEFSVLKALIESLDSGSNVAYKNFFVQLSYYLNYFFCNEKNLSKKELRDLNNKPIDELTTKIKDIKAKRNNIKKAIDRIPNNISIEEYKKQEAKIIKDIGKNQTDKELKKESEALQEKRQSFQNKILYWQNVKESFEVYDDKDKPIGLNKFEKYFLGYDEKILDVVQPKIRKFVEANELFKDTKLKAVEDEARIDEKTKHLVILMQNYLSDSKIKITYDWFNLYVNYVCQHAKMEFGKIMDGVVNQNDLEKNTDASLSFLMTDIIIEYKKALEEIESDKTNQKLKDSYNDFGVMNLFHLWQSFINAGYIFSYDLKPENMCEYIYNAYEINFLINHRPEKLIQEIKNKKKKSVDGLINNLFHNVSFVEYKLVKKMCKMSVYAFSKVSAAVTHMTQINMAQFFSKTNNGQRKFSNGVMLDENGSVSCFMVPIKTALEIYKTVDQHLSQKDINEMLPKLPKGIKWGNIDQECDLFLDQNKYKMLSIVEAGRMLCTTQQLIDKTQSSSYFFESLYLLKVLIQREQNQFNEFLLQNSDKNNGNIFNAVIEGCLKKENNSIILIKKIKDSFCFIDEIAKNGTKFGLNAAEKFISLAEKIVTTTYLKIAEIDFNQNDHSANNSKNYKDMITKYSIDILINFIGKTYFAWNNVIEEDNPKNNLCNKIIKNSFLILNIAFKYVKRDDIIKNEDLILWLYLIYKKINFDSDFFKARNRYENPLKLSDEPHFLKKYKISDGYEAISSKNVFYMNDRIQEFKEYLTKNNFSHLIFLVDCLPRDWENLTSIIKTKKNIGKLLKQKVDSKEFVSKLWKHKLSKLLEKTRNLEELFNVAQNDKNSSHAFYAVKTLYRIQRYDKLQELFLFNNLEIDVLEKLCNEISKDGTKDGIEIGLDVAKKLISLTQKIVTTARAMTYWQNNHYDNYLNCRNMITKHSIDILVNLIGKTYFTWNDVIEKDDPKNNLCNKIIKNSFLILNIAFKYVKRDDIIKNEDLILWLYLIYKKINFDSDFFKARNRYENPLKLSDEPHFLKKYKISDGYEAISSKNVFYMNDRIQEFKEYLTKNNFSHLIFLVDCLPRDWENLTSIIKTKKNIGKLLKQKVDSKEFVSRLWKHELSKLIKKTHNPKELFNVVQNDKNISHVFYAVKTLYKTKSHDELQNELQKLLLSDNMETNVLKKLCMDTKIDSYPRKEKDERDMFLDSIEIFSNLLLQEKMEISFTSAVYLIKSIANFVVRGNDDYIEKCYGDICDDKYMKYFRGDKNIFSVVSEIVGQISFPANTVMSKEKPFWPNAKENLLNLCKACVEIYYSEFQRMKDYEKLKPINKNLSFRLYLLYKKIFYDENNKGNLNLDNNKFLLCEYQPDDKIENIRKKYIFWDDYHVKDFYKWAKDNDMYHLYSDFHENVLSEEILIELAFNHGDCESLYHFNKKYPEKTQEYLLSSDENNIVQKLYSLCTEKIKDDLDNLYFAIHHVEKISFRVALAAIKFIHDFHTKFIARYTNEPSEVFKEEFDRLFPHPLGFICDVIERIYFADVKLENYVSIDEYKDFLRIVVEEIYFYNEEVKDNSIYEYFNCNKFDLIWYLYLLHKKIINNENYIVNQQSDNIEFRKVDGDYLIGDYKAYEVLCRNLPRNKMDKTINRMVNLFYAKGRISLDEFGLYPNKFLYSIDSGTAQSSLYKWIRQFKIKPILLFSCLRTKINKKVFKILAESMKEATAKEKIKNTAKKKYCFTLAKNLKQLKALDLLNKRITKTNQKNVINNWKENNKKIKFAVAKNKLEKLIKSHTFHSLKEWNEIDKRIKRLKEILKKRVQAKQTADKSYESHILKKWNENNKKIKAKNAEATKSLYNAINAIKEKTKSQTLNDLKENDKRIKQREKLKEILEKRQTKIDEEKKIKTLKKLKERNKLIVDQNQNEGNKQKRSNAWSKIKKIIFAAAVDLMLVALAIIFLETIILIFVLVALAIIFIVCCAFAIKKGCDYKNLGTKISAFEERQRELNIIPQQQIVPSREGSNHKQNNLINND